MADDTSLMPRIEALRAQMAAARAARDRTLADVKKARDELYAKANELLGQGVELDNLIAEIEAAQAAENGVPRGDSFSVPAVVRRVLAKHPEGMTSPAIVAEVQKFLPDVAAPRVHSALRNVPKKGGDRRSYVYVLSTDPQTRTRTPMTQAGLRKGVRAR